jgi:two-component system, OmpR family, sensor histidine kinase VicK
MTLPHLLPRSPLQTQKASSPSSHQRQAKKKLLQPMFTKAGDAIAVLDHYGHVMEVNDAACQLFGRSRRALVGKPLTNFTKTAFDLNPAPLSDQGNQLTTGQLTVVCPKEVERKVEYTLTHNVYPQIHLAIFRDLTQRQVQAEDELQWQRQRVELFSEVTLKIRQSLQLKEILRATVTEVQRILHADRVLIYQVLPDGTGKPISESVLPEYPAILGMEFPEEVFPEDYQKLYAQGRVRAIADVRDPAAGLAACLVEFIDQFEIQSKLIVPILQNLNAQPQTESNPQNQLWGLLIAHQCSGPRHWADFELELMQQLADQISIAIAQAQLLEHLEDVVEARTSQLQQMNRNLQQEINDRMQAESALRQSEEQLRLITNALPVLIAYVDHQQRYRFNNKAYEDWLNQRPVDIQGHHLQEVWGEDCYLRMQNSVEAALAGQVVTYENEVVVHEGSSRSVNVTYIPHLDEEKRVKGFFALTSDISDRKAIERMKDEFIAVVSHELRTPLTSMHSALKILTTGRLGTLSADGQQMLEIADENTERLVRLVNNVLDLQRIEFGEVTMDKQAYNAADLMIQAMEAMQPMAQQQGVMVSTQPQNILIWADADYIVQALTNLLSNAIKFSSINGDVTLTVAYRQPLEDSGEQEVLFQVCDQGQGIPADRLESIFERFQQVDSSDSRKKGGTGLGLAICRKIIEQHEGKIWAESTFGEGSIFSFTLPTLKT